MQMHGHGREEEARGGERRERKAHRECCAGLYLVCVQNARGRGVVSGGGRSGGRASLQMREVTALVVTVRRAWAQKQRKKNRVRIIVAGACARAREKVRFCD